MSDNSHATALVKCLRCGRTFQTIVATISKRRCICGGEVKRQEPARPAAKIP